MKAEELMIGDLVKVHFGVHNETIGSDVYGQVAELYDDGRIEVAVNDAPSSYWNIEKEIGDEILPIQLTPEILEKNGFKNRGAQFICDGICMIWWKDNIFMFSKYTRHEGLPTENISINIGYVHELQHALKLCGIEKEIIL